MSKSACHRHCLYAYPFLFLQYLFQHTVCVITLFFNMSVYYVCPRCLYFSPYGCHCLSKPVCALLRSPVCPVTLCLFLYLPVCLRLCLFTYWAYNCTCLLVSFLASLCLCLCLCMCLCVYVSMCISLCLSACFLTLLLSLSKLSLSLSDPVYVSLLAYSRGFQWFPTNCVLT